MTGLGTAEATITTTSVGYPTKVNRAPLTVIPRPPAGRLDLIIEGLPGWTPETRYENGSSSGIQRTRASATRVSSPASTRSTPSSSGMAMKAIRLWSVSPD